jgi:rod shape-determining protein MreC
MFRKFFSTKLSKVIMAVALCGLLIFLNPAGLFNAVRLALKIAVTPFQKVVYLISIKVGNTKDFIGSVGSLKNENEHLIKENQKLISENVELSDMKRQNDILKEQLEILPREKFDLETAYVISQDPEGFGSWIEISKGTESGIKVGNAAIISRGILVGKVTEAGNGFSKILLITNPESSISTMTAKAGVRGRVKGKYGLGLIFDMVLQTDEINDGDEIITSGTGSDVPRGLYIGQLRDVRQSADRLYQEANVISPVQISKLEVVSVIKNSK